MLGRLPLYGGLGTFGARGPLWAVVDLAAGRPTLAAICGQEPSTNVGCTGVIAPR